MFYEVQPPLPSRVESAASASFSGTKEAASSEANATSATVKMEDKEAQQAAAPALEITGQPPRDNNCSLWNLDHSLSLHGKILVILISFKCSNLFLRKDLMATADNSSNLIPMADTYLENNLNILLEDNGAGFNTAEAALKDGIGLKNIAVRVSKLNGRLHIDSGKGRGTTVIIDIPV